MPRVPGCVRVSEHLHGGSDAACSLQSQITLSQQRFQMPLWKNQGEPSGVQGQLRVYSCQWSQIYADTFKSPDFHAARQFWKGYPLWNARRLAGAQYHWQIDTKVLPSPRAWFQYRSGSMLESSREDLTKQSSSTLAFYLTCLCGEFTHVLFFKSLHCFH